MAQKSRASPAKVPTGFTCFAQFASSGSILPAWIVSGVEGNNQQLLVLGLAHLTRLLNSVFRAGDIFSLAHWP